MSHAAILLPPTRRPHSITYPSITREAAMRITTKGQVTIPLRIREQLGLLPNTEVDFAVQGDTVVVTKATGKTRGQRVVEHLVTYGSAFKGWTTDELMALTRGEE